MASPVLSAQWSTASVGGVITLGETPTAKVKFQALYGAIPGATYALILTPKVGSPYQVGQVTVLSLATNQSVTLLIPWKPLTSGPGTLTFTGLNGGRGVTVNDAPVTFITAASGSEHPATWDGALTVVLKNTGDLDSQQGQIVFSMMDGGIRLPDGTVQYQPGQTPKVTVIPAGIIKANDQRTYVVVPSTSPLPGVMDFNVGVAFPGALVASGYAGQCNV